MSSKISENKIISIIKVNPYFLRLKEISNSGFALYMISPFSNVYYKAREHNKYKHSIGVYELLKNYNTSLEERIMGILHDFPHASIAHIIDFMFGDAEKQEYHEELFLIYLEKSKLYKKLRKYLDIEEMYEKYRNEEYKTLDVSLPDLCADRMDYTIRDVKDTFNIDIKNMIRDVIPNEEGILVFKNKRSAYLFSYYYLRVSETYSIQSSYIYLLGTFLKKLYKKGFLGKEELLFRDEKYIYNKIMSSEFAPLLKQLRRVKIELNEKDYDIKIKTKTRILDPRLFNNYRLSEIDEKFSSLKEEFIKKYKKELRFKIYLKEEVREFLNI